jgi:hypothetical protein
MVVLKWKNGSCSDAGSTLMVNASKKVEDKVLSVADRSTLHIPTLLNDELYLNCVAVAVSHNSGQGSSFRGMECTQIELAGQTYNLAIIRK